MNKSHEPACNPLMVQQATPTMSTPVAPPTMALPPADKEILRRLAEELAAAAALPVHREKALLWTKLNDLKSARPMVWINEIPWHEMNVDDELTVRCTDSWARSQEVNLRRTIYQWKHFPGDMILDDYLACPLVIHNTRFGIEEDVDIVRTSETNGVYSRHFHTQIAEEEDLSKIKLPVVTYDEAATEENYRKMCDVYGSIMAVRKEGIKHIWYTPWDDLIRWWGVQEAMTDLIDRPELVNEAVKRCAASMHSGLDQMEKLNLLSFGANNTRVGSGGYGYTGELSAPNPGPNGVSTINNWGCSNAQIFSEVSSEMHWEFALRHDIPWLERWGMNYYGCCEPLDWKIDILRRIPRLRKISMNFLINMERAVKNVGPDYVFSYKPHPAFVAEDRWRPEAVRRELTNLLEKARSCGCHVEIILKDISTVRNQPQRLWEWERIAMEIAESFAN